MREILFRGKCVETGKWAHGDLLQHIDYGYGEDYRVAIVPSLGDSVIVIPETVAEYTGLRDKNGKKIFEGDILSTVNIDGKFVNFRVEYNTLKGRFLAVNDYEVYDVAAERFPDYTKIIGNTHDNPELMEVSE